MTPMYIYIKSGRRKSLSLVLRPFYFALAPPTQRQNLVSCSMPESEAFYAMFLKQCCEANYLLEIRFVCIIFSNKYRYRKFYNVL